MEQVKHILMAFVFGLVTSVPAAYADCSSEVHVIKKGEVAQCDGFVFGDKAEKAAAKDRDDAAYYKTQADDLTKKSALQDQQSQILDQRIKLYADESNQLSQELAGKKNTETIYRFLYFATGVLVTGAIAASVRHN